MSLQISTKYITLDVSKSKYITVHVKQYDKNIRKIIATITDNGKPYPLDSSVIPRIKCKKDDGTYVVNDCVVLEDGDVQIDVTDQMTVCSGTHDCELALFDSSTKKVLHTMNFIINVKKAVFSDDEITSSNEFEALENALLKVDNIEFDIGGSVANAEESAKLAKQYELSALESMNNATTSATDAKTAEINAEASATNVSIYESEALTSRNNVLAYELDAFKSKNNASSYESETLTSKNKTEEYMNDSAENLELIKEHISDANEILVDTNETIANANTMIDDLESVIETINANETQREFAENSRKQNEELRDKAESIREDNESKRNTAENDRKDAENVREENETKRQTGYTEMKETVNNISQSLTSHNTSSSAHSDIRDLIAELTNKLNALTDSGDETLDQLSEIVAYIKDNRELIESITTTKVNVSDIIDNLITNVSNKPLSAAQGVVLKSLIDTLKETVDGRYSFSNVKVGSTTISANTTTDTLELIAGDNVKITPNSIDNKIRILSTNTTYELSRNGSEIVLTDSEGNITSVSDNDITTTTSTTLEGSYAGGLNIIPYGKSEQDSTTGKNLLHNVATTTTTKGITFTVNEDGSVTTNGTSTDRAQLDLGTNVLPAGSYILSQGHAINYSVCVFASYKVNGESVYVDLDSAVGGERSFTLDSETSVSVKADVRDANRNIPNITLYPMIRKADVADATYEPYTGGQPSPSPQCPQEIRSTVISEVRSCGKNLLKNTATSKTVNGVTFTVNDDKSVTVNGTSTGRIDWELNKNLIIPSGKYILSGCPKNGQRLYDLRIGTSKVAYIDYGESIFKFELLESTEFLSQITIQSGTTLNNVTFYPMIRKADIEDATYEPYTETVATLSEPITLYGIPTDSDGNYTDENGQQWIADYIDTASGKVVRNAVKLNVYDETVYDWGAESYGHDFYILREQYDTTNYIARTIPAICNKLSYTEERIAPSFYYRTHNMGWDGYARIGFRVPSDVNTVDLFKEYLGEDCEIILPLKDPTVEDLPTADIVALKNLKTYDTVTHITTDSEVKPYVVSEYGTSKVGALALQSCNKSGNNNDTTSTIIAGTGLVLSENVINHKNSVTAGTAQGDTNKTLTFGGTFSIPTVSYDAQGHIIGKGTTTMTMPIYPDLVKQGLTNGNSNLPLLMSDATISNTSTEYTQVTHRNNNIYANPSIGMIASTSYKLNNKISLEYSTDTDSLNFVFL